jgi:hypothetical protein
MDVKKAIVTGSLVAIACTVALVSAQPNKPPAKDEATSIAAWADVYRVLSHPRCRNCHPIADAPLQKDDGRPHAQNITRLSEKNGLKCQACHRHRNSPLRGGPPGIPGWHMPPADRPMVFEGRSSSALCAQMKDRGATGRDLRDVVDHMSHDPLVLWGWDPGPGRTKPPIPHDKFAAAAQRWLATGAFCPPAE